MQYCLPEAEAAPMVEKLLEAIIGKTRRA
jgi:hypothetical protein